MKIAFVYDAVYPWIKGGAEKRIYEIGRRLAERGNEVHVFGIKWWTGADVIEREGMVLHGVCAPVKLYINGRRSISEAITFSIKLLPHLCKQRFDVIDVSAFPYFSCFSVRIASFLRGTPVVITWHEVWGDYWYEYMGRPGFFGKLTEHLVSKIASESIAVSAATKKSLESLRGENIHVVPNGIDLERIANIFPSADKCDVVFIGRLIREKNVDLLLEAVGYLKNTLPDVRCHIIGEGPEGKQLTELASEYGLLDNVRFLGFMDYDEVIARIKSSRVLALPSSREGFGMVVIEAFACGVPVVTIKSTLNAASLLVSEGTGFTVNPDGRELSNALLKIITDSALREKMSAACMNAAQGYDWSEVVSQLTGIYGRLV